MLSVHWFAFRGGGAVKAKSTEEKEASPSFQQSIYLITTCPVLDYASSLRMSFPSMFRLSPMYSMENTPFRYLFLSSICAFSIPSSLSLFLKAWQLSKNVIVSLYTDTGGKFAFHQL